ncbi:hypothetical protein JYK14_04280 [Siccirubricoccus sp. KC 17139]|uniref:Uncharacterized protein n=1 Tax=Siccirubricoccus soli TaxID=2899147 RepID=A0ABT1D2C6_9PROT|nr:hypothetical protein [Siccirubricoccus soli]MCO6415394.1 hypothetical protein [Siccirubricoccus soli]MCP2681526.1 hypothetical protein [Siccirubricoccus soli]
MIAHINANRTLWIVVAAVASVVFAWLRSSFGMGYHYGDLMALAMMALGMLVILKSQEGFVPQEMPEE